MTGREVVITRLVARGKGVNQTGSCIGEGTWPVE